MATLSTVATVSLKLENTLLMVLILLEIYSTSITGPSFTAAPVVSSKTIKFLFPELQWRKPAKKLNINARDTLNFCALKLADFPKAVGLNHLISKGEFPHLLNKPENWDKILDFPAPEMYVRLAYDG